MVPRSFLQVCKEALELNEQLIVDDQLLYQEDLKKKYDQMETNLGPLVATDSQVRGHSNMHVAHCDVLSLLFNSKCPHQPAVLTGLIRCQGTHTGCPLLCLTPSAASVTWTITDKARQCVSIVSSCVFLIHFVLSLWFMTVRRLINCRTDLIVRLIDRNQNLRFHIRRI